MKRYLTGLVLACVATHVPAGQFSQRAAPPQAIVDAVRNAPQKYGNFIPIRDEFILEDQILKAEDIAFRGQATIVLRLKQPAEWIAIAAKRIRVEDPSRPIQIILQQPKDDKREFRKTDSPNQCWKNDCNPGPFWGFNCYAPPAQPPKSKNGDGQQGISGKSGHSFVDVSDFCGFSKESRASSTPKLYLFVGQLLNKEGKPYPQASNMRFILAGQDGRDGADGMDGTPGGRGGDGQNGDTNLGVCSGGPGKGGKGGDGGRGGRGVDGSDGGDSGGLHLIGTAQVIDSLTYSEITLDGGKPGIGGRNGKGGQRGLPGARGTAPGTCDPPYPSTLGPGENGGDAARVVSDGVEGKRGTGATDTVEQRVIDALF